MGDEEEREIMKVESRGIEEERKGIREEGCVV